MVSETALKNNQPQETPALSAAEIQRRVSNPDISAWVSASAGTGKTKVLIDRVLRLMLPRPDGRPGTPPHKILCLTYTNAAASEMMLRIQDTLGEWATLPEADLQEKLEALIGARPTSKMLTSARGLFSKVLDSAEGLSGSLNIMTIHSFCQSVLGRFPVEARLSPAFTGMDEQEAQTLLKDAIKITFALATPQQKEILERLAPILSDAQLLDLIKKIAEERGQLADILNAPADFETLHGMVCATLDLAPGTTEADILETAFSPLHWDKAILFDLCGALAKGTKTDQTRGVAIAAFLENGVEDFEAYKDIFLTQKSEPRKLTKGTLEAKPDAQDVFNREAERLIDIENRLNAVRCAQQTADLLTIAHAALAQYESLKDSAAALDYTDLILKTIRLLSDKGTVSWAMFKLDGGIDHILLDEAQDTNPEQWWIIEALTREFFNDAARLADKPRTLFVVGDEKQSIYSFQRAAPDEFQTMRTKLSTIITAAGQRMIAETMSVSFRSVKPVLDFVDACFMDGDAALGLAPDSYVPHKSDRFREAGLVELWPLVGKDEAAPREPWTPPKSSYDETPSGASKLADDIAARIESWLRTGEKLTSQDRPITPGDIMILVRKRTRFVTPLIRALKKRNIPVAGHDRAKIAEELIAEDVLAAARTALLPDDDYTLACVLKGPLITLSEEELFTLCHGRTGTLWHALKTHKPDIAAYLESLQSKTQDTPVNFFYHLIHHPCPADEISGLRAIQAQFGGEVQEILNEFLNGIAALESRESVPLTLQTIIEAYAADTREIKRNESPDADKVRIMTVHGAKGLQAPIVILPDTVELKKPQQDSILFPHKTELSMPLWATSSGGAPALFKTKQAQLEARAREEEARLFYVAATRAEDRLYICGATESKEAGPHSLYHLAKSALENADARFVPLDDSQQLMGLRLEAAQTKEIKKKPSEKSKRPVPPIPEWLLTPVKHAPSQPFSNTGTASGGSKTLSALADSPLAIQRGLVIHTLLQHLPNHAAEHHEALLTRYLTAYAPSLKPRHEDISKTVLEVLRHPDFAPLFTVGSMAEVPVSGVLGSQIIHARIDRLCITGDEILILDYKTGQDIPQTEAQVPPAIRQQMQIYAALLRAIHPGRAVKAALLWTAGPRLMPLDV